MIILGHYQANLSSYFLNKNKQAVAHKKQAAAEIHKASMQQPEIIVF